MLLSQRFCLEKSLNGITIGSSTDTFLLKFKGKVGIKIVVRLRRAVIFFAI